MEPAPGLNLITGDNGLRRSFLLDVIWWALTPKWLEEVDPHIERRVCNSTQDAR